MEPPFYGREPKDGLHILKDAWTRKEYLGPQSMQLASSLQSAIDATSAAAHERTQGFQLGRSITEAMNDRSRERRLEAAMLRRWKVPGMWPIPGGWGQLVAFQVPLFSQEQKEGWGYIDLLGVNSAGLPVVVELKKSPNAMTDGKTGSAETPLRMVLEAAAYAVALRKNWPRFRSEWITHLTLLQIPDKIITSVPAVLETVPLVAAAPASFWIDWLPVTEKGLTVSRETWLSFQSLLTKLQAAKLPVTFVSISGQDQDEPGLAVQPLVGFPPIS